MTSRLPILLCLLTAATAFPAEMKNPNEDSLRATAIELIAQGDRLRKMKNAASMDSAIALYDSACSIARTRFGESDTAVATCLNGLGKCYYWQKDFERGEAANRKAIAIWENALGPDHPSVARGLRGLADFYAWKSSRYADAEELYIRAINLLEDAPSTYGLDFALTLSCLGEFYVGLGRFSEAESALLRAIDAYNELPGSQSHIQFLPLLDLGAASVRQGKYDEAEEYILRARDNVTQLHGEYHYYMSSVHRHLANIYAHQGRYEKAATAAERAIRIVENVFGNEHYELIPRLQNLARAELGTGNLSGARAASERAVQIAKGTFGAMHPTVSASLGHLARIYKAAGSEEDCLKAYGEMVRSRRTFVNEIFTHASEHQKLQYIRRFPVIDESFIAFALAHESERGREATLEMLLLGKALVIDAVSADRTIAYCAGDQRMTTLLRDHADVCRLIANMTLAGPGDRSPPRYQDSLSTLYRVKGDLEADLSRRCAAYGQTRAQASFDVTELARALPETGTLWEFVRYRPFHFGTPTGKQQWGSPRYGAFALAADGKITRCDLGDAGRLDSLIRACHEKLGAAGADLFINGIGEQAAEAQLAEITTQLYELVFAPLQATLGGQTRILICPDGQLSLLPFEILRGHDDRYLIEDYEISYLSSGRDLLRRNRETLQTNRTAVIIADPDFDAAPTEPAAAMFAATAGSNPAIPVRSADGRAVCLANLFRSLPETRTEGNAIAERFGIHSDYRVRYLHDIEATEGALKLLNQPPSVLHLATHGYFCSQPRRGSGPELSENPLLYSGLAMAGANRLILKRAEPDRQVHDGILTALEASALNLQGTDLVVLSACHTGVGLVENGEGVFGLRRAFQHAGARSMVMSMFAVPDDATVTLMERFYENWLGGLEKAPALRHAALAAIKERRAEHKAAHPLFWGGFVLVGDSD